MCDNVFESSCYSTQAALVGDIEATRDLCVQLQKTKESLQRQISSQSMSYEQVIEEYRAKLL